MKLDQILAKVFKFVTFVSFTFSALLYIGILLLLPLDILFQVTRLFHAIGLPTVLAGALGVAAVGYLGLQVSKMTALLDLIVDIGRQIVSFGHAQIKRCDTLIEQAGTSEA